MLQNREKNLESLQNDALQLIQNKIFLGQYTEKRYIESLQTYRDIIIIEWIEDIVQILWKTKRAIGEFSNNTWIGITSDPDDSESNNCLLWVTLNDVTIGKHWFQIQNINFGAREISLKIIQIQPYRSPDSSFSTVGSDFPTIQEIFTYSNICESFKFMTVVCLTIFSFLVEASKFISEYIIKLGYLFTEFVYATTPIWLGFLELLSKFIAGCFWLFYVICANPNTKVMPNMVMQKNRTRRRSKPLQIKADTNNYSPTHKN